ncbi:MAG: metallopeptidase family protein [Bacteroidota bacterium]|jgi:predicted Zn-dependent protease with MMP-like domain
MSREEFEKIVEESFELLPPRFKSAIENVGILVEDYPDDELVRRVGLTSKRQLLGLYQGVPLQKRGSWYGMSPTLPDKISLYQKNIEQSCRTDQEIREKIAEVLIHEIGHYFGMTDKEIRAAGY